MALVTVPAQADDSTNQLAALIAAGTHETDLERRTVEVDDCVMTTYRWRNHTDQGWMLWTSFQFDMRLATIDENKAQPGTFVIYAPIDEGPPETGLGLIGFSMADGALAQQERSVLRDPSGQTTPSSRNDGTTHYFQYLPNFIITMDGVGVRDKMRTFAVLYQDYVQTHCAAVS